jgi:hypothetical protein
MRVDVGTRRTLLRITFTQVPIIVLLTLGLSRRQGETHEATGRKVEVVQETSGFYLEMEAPQGI